MIAALTSSAAARKLGLGTDLNDVDTRGVDFEGIQFELDEHAHLAESLALEDRQFSTNPTQSLANILSMVSHQLSADLNKLPVRLGRSNDLARDRLFDLIYDLFKDMFGKPPPIREDGTFVELCTGIFNLLAEAYLKCETPKPNTWDQPSSSTIKRYIKARHTRGQNTPRI